MKIHCHLGVHKTATTFIQSQLSENRAQLAAGGIGYAGIWTIRKHFTNAFDRLSWFDPVWRPLVRPYLRKRLDALLQQHAKGETFILSDENLLGLISANYVTRRLYPRAGARVAMLDGLLRPHDVHYFISVRRYPEYLTSSWLQMAARAKAPAFEKYQGRFSPPMRGWTEIVSDIARAVGPERLTVWTYDWLRDDPARALTLLAPGVRLNVPEHELRREVLPSLSIKGLKVITQLEGHLSQSELRRLAKLIRSFPFDDPNPRLEISDVALLAAFDRKYEQDLENIRALGVDLRV
ncbi:hypothetical protein JJB09_02990 [Rhizobium sp. KVB221]|uniref:Uncharacterized protein n=1 Tax=Rhizobium setariae TaxID=2801340 RepID=A0A936YMR0_9HYPH|nr:hypothetical protein [Rhizobium setariae]MBL0370984.1 hypothetical protein [Rhizobium setariae]